MEKPFESLLKFSNKTSSKRKNRAKNYFRFDNSKKERPIKRQLKRSNLSKNSRQTFSTSKKEDSWTDFRKFSSRPHACHSFSSVLHSPSASTSDLALSPAFSVQDAFERSNTNSFNRRTSLDLNKSTFFSTDDSFHPGSNNQHQSQLLSLASLPSDDLTSSCSVNEECRISESISDVSFLDPSSNLIQERSCPKCALTIRHFDHDCVSDLKSELRMQQVRLNLLTHCVQLNNRNVIDYDKCQKSKSPQYAIIHYFEKSVDYIAKAKLTERTRAVDLLQFALTQFRLNSSQTHPSTNSTTELNYQLISTGVYSFDPYMTLRQCNRLFLPHDQDLHLCLLPKSINVKLFFSFKTTLFSLEIDPVSRVQELKQSISDLLLINWSQHIILFRGTPLSGNQILFTLGIRHGDQLSIDQLLN